MNIRDMFDNEHLAAEDLREKPWTLTIKSVAPKQLRKPGGKVDKRPVVRFVELEAKATKDKPALGLVLNRTNARTVKALYGKDTKDWIGKRITIYPTTCDSFGKKDVPCIRVEEKAPPPVKGKADSNAPVPERRSDANAEETAPPDDGDLPEPPPDHVAPDAEG